MARSSVIAVVAAVGLGLAGCAGGGFHEGGGYRGETTAYTGAAHRTTASQEPSSSALPDATLGFGNKTVSGALGSYCWESGTSAICADKIGPTVPDKDKTLRIPEGFVMEFDYGGRGKPDSVGAVAYPLDRSNEVVSNLDGSYLLKPSEGRSTLESEDLRVVHSVVGQTKIPADLPPGEYVFDIFVCVNQTLSVSVTVRPSGCR